jgi:hypothetical protein
MRQFWIEDFLSVPPTCHWFLVSLNVFRYTTFGSDQPKTLPKHVGSEILTAVAMKSTPCSPLKDAWRIGRTYHLQSSGSNKPSKIWAWKQVPSCSHTGTLLGLFFDPKDGGNIFLRNTFSRKMSDYERGLDWRLDLLPTSTHESWLHLIIVRPLISTLYSSLLHTHTHTHTHTSIFSVTLSISRFLVTALTVEILHLPRSFRCPLALNSTGSVFSSHIPLQLTSKFVSVITSRHGQRTKHRFQQFLYCCVRIRFRGNMFVFEGITQPLLLGIFAY